MKVNNLSNNIYILLCIFSVFFLTNDYILIGMPFFCIVLVFLMYVNNSYTIQVTKLFLAFLCIIVVVAVQTLFGFWEGYSLYFSYSIAVKEICRAIIYIIILQILSQLTIEISVYKKIWRLILVVVVLIAILQFTKIFDINSILIDIYGDSIQFINSQYTTLDLFRCGSVFVNPNVFASYLVAMLASTFLISDKIKEPLILKIIVYALLVAGLLFSGSRTGMALSAVLLVVYIIKIHEISITKNKIIFGLIAAIGLILIIVYLYGALIESSISEFRLFQLEEAFDSSYSIKLDIFVNMIKEMNTMNLFIGFGPFDYTQFKTLLVDFEIGYFVSYFGAIGIFLYGFLLFSIYNHSNSMHNVTKYFPTMMMIATAIFGISSGIYLNLRIFTIYMLLLLPNLKCTNDVTPIISA